MENHSIELQDFKQNIEEKIDQGLILEAKKAFLEYILRIENDDIEMPIKAEFYATYSIFLFQVGDYDGFINMMSKAIFYNYTKEVFYDIIVQAFINPNLQEFEKNYNYNIELLRNKKIILFEQTPNFEELKYFTIPNGEDGEFYIYCKEKKEIIEKVDFKKDVPLNTDNEFSDFSVMIKGSLNEVTPFAKRDLNKSVYVICEDLMYFFSQLQGTILDADFFININKIFNEEADFMKYFKETVDYLPNNVFDYTGKSSIKETLQQIRDYRTGAPIKERTPLLSICIPSYNRGARALSTIKNILNFPLDYEIEIVLSNNGTKNETQSFYEEIKNINDNRLNYFEFESNQGFALNLCKACELASGDFILLMSDEDTINLLGLYKILNKLMLNKESLGILRGSTTVQNRMSDDFKKSGREAILHYMLTSNYMSGNIYNNKILKRLNVIDFVVNRQNNQVAYLYPHMYFELVLAQYGDVMGVSQILIDEGKAEKTDIEAIIVKEPESNEPELPSYALIEERLKQHESFVELFNQLELCQTDINLYREMYYKLCSKLFHLVSIAIQIHYSKLGIDTKVLLEECYQFIIDNKFLKGNRAQKKQDIKEIESIYKFYKKR